MRDATIPSILRINNQVIVLPEISDLDRHLGAARQAKYSDISLELGNEATYLLTNRDEDRAFLVYLTQDNDGGYHGVTEDDPDSQAVVGFLLSNGQRDEWEVQETVALEDGFRALKHFSLYGGRAPFIAWHAD